MINIDNSYIATHYKINKISMSLVGQWPYQSQTLAKFIRCFWIFQHLSIFIPELIKFVKVEHNVDYIIECCGPIIFNIGTGIKFLNNFHKRKQVKNILEEIQEDWTNLDSDSEKILLSKYASFAKLWNLVYIYMCYGLFFIYVLFPLTPFIMDKIKPLNEPRPKSLLYLVEFFIDEKQYYFHILIHSCVTSLLSVMCIISTDTFYVCSIQHACGMLSILGMRLKNIKAENLLVEKNHRNLHQKIIASIIQHNKIIEYCQNINKTYSDSFFFIIGFNTLIMSLTGALTILKWGQFHEMIRNGMFAGGQLIHLLYYSIQGQYLIDQSLMISNCIYDSEWHTTSQKIKKIMTIMMMRSLNPIRINAKIFIISLSNFTLVTKTSMSYFTVLKSVR